MEKRLKRATPSTIQDKFLVGYQGWFTCHGDGEPLDPDHHGWLHWFNAPIPDGGRPCIDLWPDVSEYSPSELFPAPGLKLKSGEQAFLFSSRHPKTVQRHFRWMAKHGIDGAFLQRFVGQCDLEAGNEGIRQIRDEVGDRVMEAAEKEGRVFAIMYDVTGVAPERLQRILERDWIHLIRNKGILDSPNYLREKGQPVIALWGFGFENSRHSPELVKNITDFFRNTTPGGVYIMAGAPAYWRTATNDADRNPAYLDVWLNAFDAISPWTVGRYNTDEEIDRFAENNLKADMDLLKRRVDDGHKKIDYIPVVLPGGSGYNLSEGKWTFNGIKRKGGRFLWKQVFHAKRLGVRTIYGAMWDEYDEGTAFMPAIAKSSMLPQSDKFSFLALDEDGFEVPSDWYMRICGFAAEGLRSERLIHETFPSKELQDYWATRPKYEDGSNISAVSSSKVTNEGSASSDYQQWLTAQNEDKDEPPPPPYSLEAEESVSSSQQTVQASSSGSAVGNASSTLAPIPATSSRLSAHSPNNAANLPSSQSTTQSDAVSSLTDNFAQHRISARPGEIVSTPSGRPATSPPPPPRHPSQGPFSSARPASSSISPPPQHPSQTGPPRPNFQSRPSRPSTASGSSSNQAPSSILPLSDRPAVQQWPPPEWNVGNQVPHQPSYKPYHAQPVENAQQGWSSYPGQTGAKLSRPQTFSATSLRPAPAVAPLRPSSAMAQGTQPFPGHLDQAPYAVPFAPDPKYGGSSHELPENSYFCPGVSNAQPSFAEAGPSQMPNSNSYVTPPQSPPATSYGHINATQYDPPQATSSFPHPGHDGQFGMADYRPPPSTSPHSPPMPNNNAPLNDPSPYNYPSMPNPHPMSYFPEPSNVPPPMPLRPATTSPYNYQPSNSYQPSYETPPKPLGFAYDAVDKVAGRKTREQLESSVDCVVAL